MASAPSTSSTVGQTSVANGPSVPIGLGSPLAPNLSPQRQIQTQENNYELLDKSISNTLKRNPKMEMSKTDLLKLLGYLEGELQARDVVIAALKSEKMKQLLNSRYNSGSSDPHAALTRDGAIIGGQGGFQGSQSEQIGPTLETLVNRQKLLKSHMAHLLKSTENRHKNVVEELEKEKRKNEPTTALGDVTASGMEKERLRLMKDFELERLEKKRLEEQIKVANDSLEEEKSRHKQIVLVLLAERKKVIFKYIEERRRCKDLAQILNEEKARTEAMAKRLEEESKKALHMEAEMEKQAAQFDIERSQYKQSTASKEKKLAEQQAEIEKLRGEIEQLSKRGNGPPPPPAKPASLATMPNLRTTSSGGVSNPAVKGSVLGTGTPMVSSKVVQPTATVSSVPVSGPTTGIARSVQPGQALRTFTASTTSNNVQNLQEPAANQGLKRPTVAGSLTGVGVTGTVIVKKSIPAASIGTGRGVPPPVPPNKPVVPPKKEVAAAFLRRAESTSMDTGTIKPQFVKQNTVIANTSLQQQSQSQQMVVDDDVNPR